MINEFPRFSKLDIAHKSEVRAITVCYQPYSDFNFVSLFSWNTGHRTGLSMLNGNLVIKQDDYLTGQAVYSILGDKRTDSSLKTLLALTEEIRLVPSVVVKNLRDRESFRITLERDSFDYIYPLGKLSTLSGKPYKNKRNKVNRFQKTYADTIEVANHKSVSSHQINDLKKLFRQWASENNKNKAEYTIERKALFQLLDNFQALDLLLTEIRVDNRLVAFSINEVFGRYGLCHFEKALSSYIHSSVFVIQQAARELVERGCSRVNWEQDLGLPGLRKSKRSYLPIAFLKKYTVRLK